MTREAAQELASYLQKISGASFTILEGPPDPLPPHALWVGFSTGASELISRCLV